MSVAPDAQAILTIDLDALKANWQLLAARAAPAECAAVVKADAYGIGIEHAVPALARAGCRTFFVAHVSEGARARASLRQAGFDDPACRVFILSGFHADVAPAEAFHAAALGPVLGAAEELAAWAEVRTQDCGPSALHVDTGMNRLGFGPAEAMRLDAATLDLAGVALVMSHFVSAEERGLPISDRQIEAFEALRRGPLGAYPASLANSSGLFLASRPVYALARPGYALYGGNPTPGSPNPMRAVVRLQARILQTRGIEAGETAGYNARWTAARPTRLATIGIGYADGLPRNALSLEGQDGPKVLIDGVPCPLVGRVSMDLSIVDVTEAPAAAARVGALAEMLGPTITVDDLGALTGTIGYEILTGLGRRHTRHYVESATVSA